MKNLFLVLACACLPLSGCATPASLQPATYAQLTKADEQAVVTAELAYKSFRLAAETGINAGLIKGSVASRVAGIDNQLFAALQAVEAAYQAGNATDLATAAHRFNDALAAGYLAIGGK